MSFPYIMDLSFGSEKASADSYSTVVESISGNGGSSDLPTTPEELEQMILEDRAIVCTVSGSTVNYGKFSIDVENLSGIINSSDNIITPLEYTVDTSGEYLSITITTDPVPDSGEFYIILKQPVDNL